MDRAEILELAWRGEGLRKRVVGVERRRFELSVFLSNRMRAVVVVFPSHSRAGRHDEGRRGIMEVVDLDAGRMGRIRQGRTGGASKERSWRTQNAQEYRCFRHHRSAPPLRR